MEVEEDSAAGPSQCTYLVEPSAETSALDSDKEKSKEVSPA